MFELEPGNSSNYIALCGVYEMVDNAAKTRGRMRELGMTKTPGCSWIDTGERTLAFYQGDVCFPSSEMFCEVLDGLRRIMAMESSCDIDHEVEGLEGT